LVILNPNLAIFSSENTFVGNHFSSEATTVKPMAVAGYPRGTWDKTWEKLRVTGRLLSTTYEWMASVCALRIGSVYIPHKATPEETPKNTTTMQVSPLSPSSLGSEALPLSA
jgi:hypothetical protein